MPATVVCPECAAELQLQRAPTTHAAIRCCECQNVFTIDLIDTVPLATTARARNLPPAAPPRPAPRPVTEMSSPPPPPPRVEDTGVSELLSPPPPVVSGQVPGLPRPNALPRTVAARFHPPFYETVLGMTLIVGVLVGLVAGGLVLWRVAGNQANATPSGVAKGDGPETKVNDKGKEAPIVPAKSNLPAELVGGWDARCDDATVMSLELYGNGNASFAQSDDGSTPPALRGFWMEKSHKGNEYEFDFVAAANAYQPVRFTVTLTSPDTFTLTRQVFRGAANYDKVRFVRRP